MPSFSHGCFLVGLLQTGVLRRMGGRLGLYTMPHEEALCERDLIRPATWFAVIAYLEL